MGDRVSDRDPPGWALDVGKLRDTGAAVYLACTSKGCQLPTEVDVAGLAATYGDAFTLWDRRSPCGHCGRLGHFMASPASGTPHRPMKTGIAADARRELFLRSFGFSALDTLRIRKAAERVTPTWNPPPLRDLDVPFTVGAFWPGREPPSGQFLGYWHNMTLIYWPMNPAEREVWAARPKGPRSV